MVHAGVAGRSADLRPNSGVRRWCDAPLKGQICTIDEIAAFAVNGLEGMGVGAGFG